jgi:hypothetical protein
MKTFLLLLTLALLAAAAAPAAADDKYLCWTVGSQLQFGRIPGPGTHEGIELVGTPIYIPGNSDALAFDGEHWWVGYLNIIYCFDKYGDFVAEFAFPEAAGYASGLAWDGQYLWIATHDGWVYQRDTNGNPGPYGQFEDIYAPAIGGLEVVGDKLLIGTIDYYKDPSSNNRLLTGENISKTTTNITGKQVESKIQVFDFNGNYLFDGEAIGDTDENGFISLAYADGIVWASYYINYGTYAYEILWGYTYNDSGGFGNYAVVLDFAVQDLAVCDAAFVRIASTSLGKIKAYFANENK